jgi:hypothetical protein
MSLIILKTPKKRYQGESSTGKSHKFITSGYGGKFYSIPKLCIESWTEYEETINDSHKEPYIEVRFNMSSLGSFGELKSNLEDVIDYFDTNHTETKIEIL